MILIRTCWQMPHLWRVENGTVPVGAICQCGERRTNCTWNEIKSSWLQGWGEPSTSPTSPGTNEP